MVPLRKSCRWLPSPRNGALSAGGLRIINNKILQHEYGIQVYLGDGLSTSILLIQGNSIENFAENAIQFDKHAGGTFYRIIIDGNQIATSTASADGIVGGSTSAISR